MIKNYDLILRGILVGLFSVSMMHTNQQIFDVLGGPIGIPLICLEYIAVLWLVDWIVGKVELGRKRKR